LWEWGVSARELLSIGRFARACRLSIKALRHYDELGLLRPARVDASGYRYYERSQARAAIAISLLRTLDVPLPAITEILASSIVHVDLAHRSGGDCAGRPSDRSRGSDRPVTAHYPYSGRCPAYWARSSAIAHQLALDPTKVWASGWTSAAVTSSVPAAIQTTRGTASCAKNRLEPQAPQNVRSTCSERKTCSRSTPFGTRSRDEGTRTYVANAAP
jgi:DNA-binding transcriptional MerR regulator